ncbi:MAG: adenosylcobinamide-GDP ribazoletransferase [Chloroflexota bacterium]
MKHIRIAFNLLTTLPIRAPADWQPGDSGRAAGWYPFVGLVLGLLVAAAYLFANRFLPPFISSGLALALWVALTGGLHLDGLSDCCDGLFHPSDPERRLEIMKDPHLGAFGAIGLGLALLLKFAALASLPPERAARAILLAASLGRWAILPAGFQPLAKAGGMGADFAGGLRKLALARGAIIPLGLTALLGLRGLLAVTLALLAAIGLLRFARARIGGITGDVFGLLVETVEIVTLLTLTA